jgi:pimeloyl-ACP methyl ester carboxylesterase
MARFDLARLVDGFRQVAGDEVAGLAGRDDGGEPVSDDEWGRVFAAFGPAVPDADALARRTQNLALGPHGMALMRRLDLIARELPAGLARLEIIEGAGHFPWLDRPDAYFSLLADFVTTCRAASPRSGR